MPPAVPNLTEEHIEAASGHAPSTPRFRQCIEQFGPDACVFERVDIESEVHQRRLEIRVVQQRTCQLD